MAPPLLSLSSSRDLSPSKQAPEAADVPKPFAQLLQTLGVTAQGPAIYTDFVGDVQGLIYLADVPRHGTPCGSSFLGIVVGGICVLRLSFVVASWLKAHAQASKLRSLLQEPTELIEALEVLLQAVVSSGAQGVFGLTFLAMEKKNMILLADLVQAQVNHPNRKQVLEREEDHEEEARLKASERHVRYHMLDALNAMLSILISEARPELCLHHLRRPPLVHPPSTGLRTIGAYSQDAQTARSGHGKKGLRPTLSLLTSELPPPPFSEDADLLAVAVQAIWNSIDKDHDGNLDVSEGREMLRLVISRPVFGLLIKEHVLRHAEEELHLEHDALSLAPQALRLNDLALGSVHLSVNDMASSSPEVGLKLWKALDSNGNRYVTREEFTAKFLDAFQAEVLQPFIDHASQVFRKKLEAPTSPRLTALNLSAERLAGEHLEGQIADGRAPAAPTTQDSAASGAPATSRAVCNVDWLLNWLRAKGRNCAS